MYLLFVLHANFKGQVLIMASILPHKFENECLRNFEKIELNCGEFSKLSNKVQNLHISIP